jgi:hypothetical protein
VTLTGERFSWYGSDDLRTKFETPCYRQYKKGDFMAVRPLNWDAIIDMDDDDEGWADSGAPSSGRSRPFDCNGKMTVRVSRTPREVREGPRESREQRMGWGKGWGKGIERGTQQRQESGSRRDTVKRQVLLDTLQGEIISVMPLGCRLQKEMYRTDSDTES